MSQIEQSYYLKCHPNSKKKKKHGARCQLNRIERTIWKGFTIDDRRREKNRFQFKSIKPNKRNDSHSIDLVWRDKGVNATYHILLERPTGNPLPLFSGLVRFGFFPAFYFFEKKFRRWRGWKWNFKLMRAISQFFDSLQDTYISRILEKIHSHWKSKGCLLF